MRSFFKIFFASFLAIIVFCVLLYFLVVGMVAGLASQKVNTGAKAVLTIDLSNTFLEIQDQSPLEEIANRDAYATPSLYDVIRLIHRAKNDSAVKGIYLKADGNGNGFGASEEIRNALLEFKSGGKFIYAYGDIIPQRAYHVANVANKIYCNPKGGVDWRGFSLEYIFMKGTLERLKIDPQIFYAGKFKSATEPFRETKMTDANRLQSTELLGDLYAHFLTRTAQQRKIDTATLYKLANENSIRFAADAVKFKLVDGIRYDDQVKDEIKQILKVNKLDKINFVPIAKYAHAVEFTQQGRDRIAVIYATGDIIDGKGQREQIGSETYVNLIRKVRLTPQVKAIVLRINSGGGSALASENILRELMLAKKDKPVVVSFGDVAASGAYYLSSNADSIFAQPNTITGSIGVFTLIPNMQEFFDEKLGVTFDGVKTAEHADAMTVTKPLSEMEKRFVQESVDSIYKDFLGWVAVGRKKNIAYVDSIGQGRIWSGNRALEIGLVDRIGGLQDAIHTAARMARLSQYKLREYPQPESLLEKLLGGRAEEATQESIKEELGTQGYQVYKSIRSTMNMMNRTQARMPFEITIN